jgi:hypothetical protein
MQPATFTLHDPASPLLLTSLQQIFELERQSLIHNWYSKSRGKEASHEYLNFVLNIIGNWDLDEALNFS